MRLAQTDPNSQLIFVNPSFVLTSFLHPCPAPGDGDDEDMQLERVFHDWVGGVFVPTALKASRKKKLLGGAEKFKAAAAKVIALNKAS